MANPAWIDATADPTPGSRGFLKWWWCFGPGAVRWVPRLHPWTSLYHEMLKHKDTAPYAKQIASAWFHTVFHYWPGERKGLNPIGPG